MIPDLHVLGGAELAHFKAVFDKKYYVLDGQLDWNEVLAICIGLAVAAINCSLGIGAEESPFNSSQLSHKDLDLLEDICKAFVEDMSPFVHEHEQLGSKRKASSVEDEEEVATKIAKPSR